MSVVCFLLRSYVFQSFLNRRFLQSRRPLTKNKERFEIEVIVSDCIFNKRQALSLSFVRFGLILFSAIWTASRSVLTL